MASQTKCTFLIFLLFFLFPLTLSAGDSKSGDTVTLVTDFTYTSRKGDSIEISKALAFFGAKIKAVTISAKYLTHKGLLEHYGKRQHEMFCLTTNEVDAFIIEESFNEQTKSYYVKIKTEVGISDFIRAEIKDSELEKKESELSYRDEMEQYVIKTIDPGRELARAYRHIRKGEWRIAIIYIDHLQRKYPNWGDTYLAKAIVFYAMDHEEKMTDALKTACSLNNEEACEDLKMIVQTGDTDLRLNQE